MANIYTDFQNEKSKFSLYVWSQQQEISLDQATQKQLCIKI